MALVAVSSAAVLLASSQAMPRVAGAVPPGAWGLPPALRVAGAVVEAVVVEVPGVGSLGVVLDTGAQAVHIITAAVRAVRVRFMVPPVSRCRAGRERRWVCRSVRCGCSRCGRWGR